MDDHMVIAGNAFATRQNYLRGVKLLMLHYQKLPDQCSVEEVKSFLSEQKKSGAVSSSTLNVRVACLKYYYRNIAKRLDLVVSIPNPKQTKYDTEILNKAEIRRLLKSCRDLRQILIVQLLYECGLRISEVVKLRVSDFNKEDATIHIRKSKGQRTRTVNYGQQLRTTLIKYAKTHGLHSETLIDSYVEPGKPLSISGIQHVVREVIRRSGIKKKASCHTLRHTHAVHYLNAGGSIFTLQRLLGHSNIRTTLEYLKHAKVPDGVRLSILDALLTN